MHMYMYNIFISIEIAIVIFNSVRFLRYLRAIIFKGYAAHGAPPLQTLTTLTAALVRLLLGTVVLWVS